MAQAMALGLAWPEDIFAMKLQHQTQEEFKEEFEILLLNSRSIIAGVFGRQEAIRMRRRYEGTINSFFFSI